MKLMRRVKDAIRVLSGRARAAAVEDRSQSTEPFTARRWEAADTDRLNQAHWQNVTGVPINVDLTERLETLRTRSAQEIANNGMVAGMVTTYADDVVGDDGPSLQVQSDDDAYNEAAEAAWREWFAKPTPKPNVSGAQMLKLWVRSLFGNGEFLAQLITDPSAIGPVSLRVLPLHVRRLATPAEFAGDPNVVMGIRFNGIGAPTQYYLTDPMKMGAYEVAIGKYKTIPPVDVIHEYLVLEEDQARGVPWLAPTLQAAADLRDYDSQVLDAMRQAADMAVFWYTEHPDCQYLEVNQSVEIERRMQQTGPPGWKPMQLQPHQPGDRHLEYRKDKLAEVGRPVGMPLMMIRLDSSSHSYSSARFDGQIYSRQIRGVQNWMSGTPKSTGTLNRLVDEVLREARFSNPALTKRPKKVSYAWIWPTLPHVDPTKEGEAEEIALNNWTLSLDEALAARGKDLESHVARLKRVAQVLKTAGLPEPPWLAAAQNQAAQVLATKAQAKASAATAAKGGGGSSNAADDEEVPADE